MEKNSEIRLNNLKDLVKTLQHFNSFKLSEKCFLSNCNQSPIKSHSISKNKVLKQINENDGKNGIVVYTLDDADFIDWGDYYFTTYQKSNRKLRHMGINEASVFEGFCSDHDGQFFQAIDNYDFVGSKETLFLHSIRTKCNMVSKMKENIKIFKYKVLPDLKLLNIEETLSKLDDALKFLENCLSLIPNDTYISYEVGQSIITEFESINNQVVLDRKIMSNELKKQFKEILNKSEFPMKADLFKNNLIDSLEKQMIKIQVPNKLQVIRNFEERTDILDLEVKENMLSIALNKKNYSIFCYYHRIIPYKYRIAGGFELIIDNHEYTLTFFPENDYTVFIFSNLQGSNDIFYKQLNIMSDKEFLHKVSQLIILFGQNTYFAPSVWKAYEEDVQNCVLNRKIQNHLNLFN